MRSFKEFFSDVIRKPPMLFPFIGLFHVLWLGRTLWSLRHEPFDVAWLQVAWMSAYTVCWIGICDLRRWAQWGYLALTLLNAILFLSLKSIYNKDVYTSSIFLIDALFSFFILFYYKRLSPVGK
jgi:hypothetical protein